MKIVLLFALLIITAPVALLAQTVAPVAANAPSDAVSPADNKKWSASRPTYPYAARAKGEQGEGFVRVSTDGSGHVGRATMVKSTGSDVLDAHTISWAKAHWKGPANTTASLPIAYRLGGGTVPQKWYTPAPPIPSNAPADPSQRKVSVQVSTDSSGRIVSANIVQSSGSEALDKHTVSWAKARWRGPSNATATVPVTYLLR